MESLAKEWIAGYSELSINKRTRINEAIRSGKQFHISDNVLKGTCYIIANRNNLTIEFSDKITQNGVWHKQGKNTYAVINANMEADTIRHTILHETFHDLSNRKDFTELVNDAYAKSLENDRAEVEARTAQYKEQFPNMSEQAIKEEIAADYFGKELSGEETFSETFSYKYKSIWQQAKLYITNLASKLRGKDRYTHSEVNEVGKLFDNLIKGEYYKEQNSETIRYALMNDKSFENNVRDIISMTDAQAKENKAQGNFISILKNTPKVILDNVKGSENLEVIIRFDALYLASRGSGVLEGHYHNLGENITIKLPEYIANPEAIVRMKNGRLNLLTTMETRKGSNGIIAIELNTVKDINSKYTKYNLIVSAFTAKDNYIKNTIEKKC